MKKHICLRVISAALVLILVSAVVPVVLAQEEQEDISGHRDGSEYIKAKVLSVVEVDISHERDEQRQKSAYDYYGNEDLDEDEYESYGMDYYRDAQAGNDTQDKSVDKWLEEALAELEAEWEITREGLIVHGYFTKKQLIEASLLDKNYKGETIHIENMMTGTPAYDIDVKEGDRILLLIEREQGQIANAYVVDHVRDHYLHILLISFIVLLILLGGFKGLKTVITLSVTIIIILKVLLPLLLYGVEPILITIIVSAIITIIVILTVGGLNFKSFSAIAGTLIGVSIAGLIAFSIGSAIKLTGLSGDEARMLQYVPQSVSFDFRGLLFAGIIIGALGAVMDVSMSVSSAIHEISYVDSSIGPLRLMKSGLNVGRDIMGTMSNTLILAYTGSSIQLLLLFMAYNDPLVRIINMDLIATEIVRAVAGSIGLVLTIPFTAVIAGFLTGKFSKKAYEFTRKKKMIYGMEKKNG